MTTGLESLCNNRISAEILKPARLRDRRRGAEDLATHCLETIDKGFVGQPEWKLTFGYLLL